jgi:acyl-CoA thioester hydrolase
MGIVHHSNYPVWFEAARTGFFRKLGFPYSKIEGEGILLPLTDIKCCFKNPARYEDEIEIRVKMVELTCVRIIFSYEVYNSLDKSLIATGETAHAWTDRNLKPLNLEKRLPELYKGLKRILI